MQGERVARAVALRQELGPFFERALVPVIVVERGGRFATANDAALAQYGYGLDELVEMRIHDFMATAPPRADVGPAITPTAATRAARPPPPPPEGRERRLGRAGRGAAGDRRRDAHRVGAAGRDGAGERRGARGVRARPGRGAVGGGGGAVRERARALRRGPADRPDEPDLRAVDEAARGADCRQALRRALSPHVRRCSRARTRARRPSSSASRTSSSRRAGNPCGSTCSRRRRTTRAWRRCTWRTT